MAILVKSIELYSTDIFGNKDLVFEAKGRYAFNKVNAYFDTEAVRYPLNQGKLHIFRVTWEDGAVVSGKISIYHTSNIHYSEHINKVSRVLQASAEKKIKQTLVAGDFIYSESSKTFQFIKDRNGFTGLVDCLMADKYRMELRMAA